MAHTSNIIAVKHNIEVAHRLYELPGKCEQIHGHSMWVTMKLRGQLNDKGILCSIEYGDLKKTFRGYLDSTYDHRLLLNASDPFSRPIFMVEKFEEDLERSRGLISVNDDQQLFLPGLQVMTGDPTTENLAKWIAEDMREQLNGYGLEEMVVEVWETSVNMAAHTIWGTDAR